MEPGMGESWLTIQYMSKKNCILKVAGTFKRFKEALEFYDQHINSFASDIMTLDGKPERVEEIAKAYVTSGKYKKAVADLIANKLIVNVHERGNCSVVCMQRLPYDLKHGALQADTLQGFKINANLDRLKQANLILNDSVGSGMTRSAFLQRV